jgi:tetratricopeptide (TPR) repeat protein
MRKRLLALVAAAILILGATSFIRADDFSTIQQQVESGDYTDAINALRALISQNPNNAAAYFWLGRCYYELRGYDNAVTQLEKATSLDANSSTYHDWLGRAYGEKADRDHSFLLAKRVKQEFAKAVELDPSNLQARRDLEDFLLEAPWIVGGSKDDALAQVNEIAKINELQGHLARADYFVHLGKNEEAEAEYNAAISMNPQKVDVYFETADYYGKQKNGAEVEKLALEAAQVDPKDVRLAYYHGEARVLMGNDLTVAEEDLKSYLASSPRRSDWPSHAAARYWLGRLYEREGKTMEAAEQYRAALQLDPGRKDAQRQLEAIEKSIH